MLPARGEHWLPGTRVVPGPMRAHAAPGLAQALTTAQRGALLRVGATMVPLPAPEDAWLGGDRNPLEKTLIMKNSDICHFSF